MVKKIALVIIRAYQLLLSPVLRPSCRFIPSCSHYAFEAINRHGVIKGTLLSIVRLAKCHPFHKGGYDPVPLNRCSRN